MTKTLFLHVVHLAFVYIFVVHLPFVYIFVVHLACIRTHSPALNLGLVYISLNGPEGLNCLNSIYVFREMTWKIRQLLRQITFKVLILHFTFQGDSKRIYRYYMM